LYFSQIFVAAFFLAGPVQAQPSYQDVINAAKPTSRCTLDEGLGRCHGFPHKDLWKTRTDPTSAKQLADWARALKWDKNKSAVYRPQKQALEIAQIDDIQRFWLPDLGSVTDVGKRAMFVARLSADMSQDPDDDYGAGRRTAPMYKQFFIVMDSYAPDAATYTHDSYQAGTFSIFGVASRQVGDAPMDQLEQVPLNKTLYFRICAAMHSQAVKNQGAQFKSCDNATKESQLLKDNPPFADALRGRSIFDAIARLDFPNVRDLRSPNASLRQRAMTAGLDLLMTRSRSRADALRASAMELLLGTSDDPAWMPCGVGCCTADDTYR
jgi:hypothetical protein